MDAGFTYGSLLIAVYFIGYYIILLFIVIIELFDFQDVQGVANITEWEWSVFYIKYRYLPGKVI